MNKLYSVIKSHRYLHSTSHRHLCAQQIIVIFMQSPQGIVIFTQSTKVSVIFRHSVLVIVILVRSSQGIIFVKSSQGITIFIQSSQITAIFLQTSSSPRQPFSTIFHSNKQICHIHPANAKSQLCA